jgi:hypothetical protein
MPQARRCGRQARFDGLGATGTKGPEGCAIPLFEARDFLNQSANRQPTVILNKSLTRLEIRTLRAWPAAAGRFLRVYGYKDSHHDEPYRYGQLHRVQPR